MALLAAVAFLWATPFLWTLVASFRPEGAGSVNMASLAPDTPQTLDNFRNALESGAFGLYYVNTIIVVLGLPGVPPGFRATQGQWGIVHLSAW